MLVSGWLGRVMRIQVWGPHSMPNHLPYDVLSRVVERRATSVEEAKAQRHLAACGRCRSELSWLERIRDVPRNGADKGDAMGETWSHEASSFWQRGGISAPIG
jgi:hypothetical protein